MTASGDALRRTMSNGRAWEGLSSEDEVNGQYAVKLQGLGWEYAEFHGKESTGKTLKGVG